MQDTPSDTINSISEFLHAAGTQFRIIDMGRGFVEIPAQTFLDLEYQKLPAPSPRQQHMWFGCVFWQSSSHFIWFIKLPLDERGLLNLAARNTFLEKVVVALGAELENTERQQGQLGDNPFTFVPGQQQLSDFNAYVRQLLVQPESQYFAPCLTYIQQPQADYSQLPVQGLSEIAMREAEPRIQQALLKQFAHYPLPVQQHLLTSFENKTLSKPVAVMLAKLFAHTIAHIASAEHNAATVQQQLHTLLRALNQAPLPQLQRCVDQLLQQPRLAPDTLVVIAARGYRALAVENTMNAFLAHLLQASDEIVLGLYQDLVQLPITRPLLLARLHDPKDNTGLAQRIKAMVSA
jgi:hypothetical protein